MKLFVINWVIGTAVAVRLASLGQYQVFEKLPGIPSPWVVKDDTPVDTEVSFKLRIHLKNQNMDSLHQKVLDVSLPDSLDYGRHLSRLELRDMLAPSKKSFDLVLDWLELQGLSKKATVESDWIIVDGTISDAENLLQTKYQVFQDTATGKSTARTLAYSLPASLHAHIDIVAPTIKFSTPSAQRSTIVKDFEACQVHQTLASVLDVHDGLNVTACNVTITPDCLKALYKFKHFRGSRRNGNELALAGFLEEYAQHSDLAAFLTTYDPEAAGSDFAEILINGGLQTQDNVIPGQSIGEANLDIQYGLALAYPTPTTYFSTGGRPPETTSYEVDNEPYLEFLTYLLGMDKIPQTISISYGDAEWTVPPSYGATVCNLFAQVAARGVTVLVSSGDDGSGGDCSAVDSTKLLYTPGFPAGCPWVTTVGATRYVVPELAVSFSGGGFSNYFPRQSWQDEAVSTYLSTEANATFKKYYNTSGRAYPDVAAQGVRFHAILDGKDGQLSGTSAASPAFAGVVALLNSDRISNGLPPFGFLNPWLYSKGASGMVDIVGGKGGGCPSQIAGSGFTAVPGWDPITGLGTPDFKLLRFASTGIVS